MFRFLSRRNETGGTSPNFNPDPNIKVVVNEDGTIKKNPAVQGKRQWPLVGRSKARRNAARQRVARSARS